MINITPQSVKQNLLTFKAEKAKQFTDNKPQLVEFMLQVLDLSSKNGTRQVSMGQFSDVARIYIAKEMLKVKGAEQLIDDNREELKQELLKLGFKFNTEQPDYIVFEEQ